MRETQETDLRPFSAGVRRALNFSLLALALLCLWLLARDAHLHAPEVRPWFAWVFQLGALAVVLAAVGGAMMAMPVAFCAALARRREAEVQYLVVRIVAVIIIVGVSIGLAAYQIHLHVAFSFSRTEMEAACARVGEGLPALGRVGLYHVDHAVTDPRGGVYLRVDSEPDELSTTRSFGFAYEPNRAGSPFGDRRYVTTPLAEGWSYFQAQSWPD